MSKFVVFTYVWQALMAILFLGAVVLAVWAGVSGAKWWTFAINALTFAILFATAYLWRATARLDLS